MFNPSFDRTEWRSRYDCELIEAARDSNHELCIALGERLEDLADLPDQIYDLTNERDELRVTLTDLQREYKELHDALMSAAAE